MFFIDWLGELMKFCYSISSSYILAIVIFTAMTKVILLPVSIWTHMNSIKYVKMLPDINGIKLAYYGDRDIINEKTLDVYKKFKYNPIIDVIPMILQLVLLFGFIEIINNPQVAGLTNADMIELGFDFSIPTVDVWGLYILMPIVAALSSFLMSFTQNKSHVMQSEQGNLNKYGTLALSVGLSLYLGFFVRSGVVIYWVASNLLSILQMYLLNIVISPKKHIDYDKLEKSKKELSALNKLDSGLTREQKIKQRKDYKRFFSVSNKHIVFYSEGSGYYKYFRRLINWLIDNSNIIIHYVTSDPNDKIFGLDNDRIKSYFIGERKLITLFMKMDSDMCIMSTPDLDNYQLKRSYVKPDIEYIYIDHSIGDVNMGLRYRALDNFDTIFCTSVYTYDEMRAREQLHNLKQKTLVQAGYDVLDDIVEEYNKSLSDNVKHDKFVLIAPSYQKDNILELCLDDIVPVFLALGYKVVVRPHPQFVRRKSEAYNDIVERYKFDSNVIFESDFSVNSSIYQADLLVTDWSGITYEYSFATLRPVLFIDTPPKIVNPNYKELNIEPMEMAVRDKIGMHVDYKDTDAVRAAVVNLTTNNYHGKVKAYRDSVMYNIGGSVEIEGNYILDSLMKKES